MKSAILSVKMDPKVKKQAKDVASNLGFSLSSLVNVLLLNVINTGEIHLGQKPEEPSDYLINSLKEAEQNRKEGWVSPAFNNAEDAITWLDDPNRKYVRDL